jgi:hypothetical protein
MANILKFPKLGMTMKSLVPEKWWPWKWQNLRKTAEIVTSFDFQVDESTTSKFDLIAVIMISPHRSNSMQM